MGIESFFKGAFGKSASQDSEAQDIRSGSGAKKNDNADSEASFEISSVPKTASDLQRPAEKASVPLLPELEHNCFCALMDKLPDAVYFKDLQSRFLMTNKAQAINHFSLMDPSQSIGRTDFDYFSQEHARRAYETEQQIIITGQEKTGIEEKETWPDGHVSWVLTSKFPLQNTTGKTIGTWGISQDITELKRTEEELKASEDKLRHSQKMEAFGQLAGGIAHDFNNMLSVITGNIQLIEMDLTDADPDIKRRIDMVIDTAKKAADLNQQLLAFARKGNHHVVALEVHEVIHTVVNLLEHTIDKRIRIVERLNARTARIMGDYTQLQNALLNLALNARDAMPEGGTLTFTTETIGADGEITPSSSAIFPPGSFLCLTVCDTGTGMDEKTRQRAFEPFFTTKPQGKGTGLGLASVYGTVKSHNGLIELESEPGSGTTFTIFLPVIHKNAEEEAGAESARPMPKGTAHLLVIDDEEDVRMVISEMVSKLGYTVATCEDGAEGIEYYKSHMAEIDAVVVDMLMPRMSGYDCIKHLKQMNPKVKILISSGYSLVSDTQKIIARGIAGFIQKPFQIEELAYSLTQVVRGK